MEKSVKWSKNLRKKKNTELRKSYLNWHMPSKERLKFGWNDRDQLAVVIKFGNNSAHHEQSIVLSSGGTFRIDKKIANRLEQLAKENHPTEVTFTACSIAIQKHINEEFTNEVNLALERSSEERLKRLKIALVMPEVRIAQVLIYKRNADVVAEVLWRANGKCEVCGNAAPFRREDGTYYLEVHHKIWLAHDGPDTVANAVALCPNCHREAHSGQQIEWLTKSLRAEVRE